MNDVEHFLLILFPIRMMVGAVLLLALLVWLFRTAWRFSRSVGKTDASLGTKSAAHALGGLEFGSAGEQDGGLESGRDPHAQKRQHDACQFSPVPPPTENCEQGQMTSATPATGPTMSVPGARAPGRVRQFGTQTGLEYAAEFVAAFVTWAQRNGQYGEWAVDQLLRLATFHFAREAGIRMPVDRNFLGAMKRHPAVVVKSHRRVYDNTSGRVHKTTLYRLRPAQGSELLLSQFNRPPARPFVEHVGSRGTDLSRRVALSSLEEPPPASGAPLSANS